MLSAAYIQVHFRLYFIVEANTMNPEQTAPLGAVRSGSILFAIRLENMVMEEQTTKVVTGGKSVNPISTNHNCSRCQIFVISSMV